jgi:hypothetical protein
METKDFDYFVNEYLYVKNKLDTCSVDEYNFWSGARNECFNIAYNLMTAKELIKFKTKIGYGK